MQTEEKRNRIHGERSHYTLVVQVSNDVLLGLCLVGIALAANKGYSKSQSAESNFQMSAKIQFASARVRVVEDYQEVAF